jgi:hypothetical protein
MLSAFVVLDGYTTTWTALVSVFEAFNGGLSSVICDTETGAEG